MERVESETMVERGVEKQMEDQTRETYACRAGGLCVGWSGRVRAAKRRSRQLRLDASVAWPLHHSLRAARPAFESQGKPPFATNPANNPWCSFHLSQTLCTLCQPTLCPKTSHDVPLSSSAFFGSAWQPRPLDFGTGVELLPVGRSQSIKFHTLAQQSKGGYMRSLSTTLRGW